MHIIRTVYQDSQHCSWPVPDNCRCAEALNSHVWLAYRYCHVEYFYSIPYCGLSPIVTTISPSSFISLLANTIIMGNVIELHASGKDWKSSTQPASPSSGEEVADNGSPYSEGMQIQDSHDMRRMGKKQQFRRNFNVISISSFCLAVMMGFVFIPM